jgi:DNA-binding Lrp family transcriptional regulator
MSVISQGTFKSSSAQAITLNGIPQPTPAYTVLENGGINRGTQPYSSGIYTVRMEASRKEGDILAIEKGDTPKTPKETPKNKVTFRRYRRLHLHRMDAIVEVNKPDNNTIESLLKALGFENYEEKHTSGKAYTTTVYREKRGETITISLSHKTNTYTVRITTHKLQRLKLFLNYAYTVLKVNRARTIMIETYIRYLERFELKIAKSIEALDVELGKGIKQHMIPSRGKHDYYLTRADLEYRGAEVVLKTYRHRSYRKRKPMDPEYHPKIEQLTILKNQPITINLESTIRYYATLIYTLLHTINPRIILGEYETSETETIEVNTLDRTIQRYIRGITKRLKAETILEEQYPDKRIAIAKLLVEKKMRPIDIARLLGYSKRHTLRIIRELIDAGIIKRVGRGKYEWNNKRGKLKPRIVEDRHMTLSQFIEFVKERKPRVVSISGTPAVEYEDEYAIRRVIISNIVVYENQVIERYPDRKLSYLIPRNQLERWLKQIELG